MDEPLQPVVRVMGRPDLGQTVNTAIRMKPKLHEALKAAAEEREVSVNFLINRAVEDFLPRLIPVEHVRWTKPPPPENVEEPK